jgi:hypothetical protein
MRPGIFCKLGKANISSSSPSIVELPPPLAFERVCNIVWKSQVICIEKVRLASAGPGHAALHALDLGLELLDDRVALLEIFVEAVPLGNELLLPLPETLLLDLDLLSKALAKSLFLLLEFGVVELAGTGLAELAGLHLACAVDLVVVLFGCVDEVEHVGANENGPELLEVAVLLVLHLGNTPAVLATLDGPAIRSGNVLLAANDGERHCLDERACVLEAGVVVLLERRGVDLDVLGLDDGADL